MSKLTQEELDRIKDRTILEEGAAWEYPEMLMDAIPKRSDYEVRHD